MSGSFDDERADLPRRDETKSPDDDSNWVDDAIATPSEQDSATGGTGAAHSLHVTDLAASQDHAIAPPLSMVETAFLASTASLLWLVSYYLSIGPWMRILFPIPIALVYLRWGNRAAWMSAFVSGLLLSVLMGPYLSVLFFVPYALLGVQLGALWRRQAPWLTSIGTGTLIATLGFFFRIWLLSTFLGEDLWTYVTNRIADFVDWGLSRLVSFGVLGVGMLGQTDLTVIQLITVGVILVSDFIYLFTVHLAAWLLLERLGNPIPEPPQWVQVLLEEE